jgi:hypothetical protein
LLATALSIEALGEGCDPSTAREVEKIFRQSAEFCSEDESWKLNVAHIFFMQEKSAGSNSHRFESS